LTAARDLLSNRGSIFVQIGDQNVHRVRAVLDEIFRPENFISLISFQTTTGFEANYLGNMSDFVLWYAKDKEANRSNPPYYRKEFELGEGNARWLMLQDWSYRGVSARERRGEQPVPSGSKPYKPDNILSQGRPKDRQPFRFRGKTYDSWEKNSHWKANYPEGMERLAKANRIHVAENSIQYVRYHTDFDAAVHGNIWTDTGSGNFTDEKVYVVQTNTKVVERCILMATDPGDLVLDPTCGSGTTAYVAEQWGRRWITIDTSRVALALARARVMGARYFYYFLADSRDGQIKEAEIRRTQAATGPTHGDIRLGFVCDRLPHIKLGQIANNVEIDVIWEKYQLLLEPLRGRINQLLGQRWEEWEVPSAVSEDWSDEITELHKQWCTNRVSRQKEIDASIAAQADSEYLRDKPYEDKRKVRVAGPFTVESLSPHRVLSVGDDDELHQKSGTFSGDKDDEADFVAMILENLKTSGVQQAHREDKIIFFFACSLAGILCLCGRQVRRRQRKVWR